MCLPSIVFLLGLMLTVRVRGQMDIDPASNQTNISNCVDAPKQCPNSNITFWLYTRSTRNNPFQLNGENVKDAPYAEGVPFVVLIHGFAGSKDIASNPELRAALFEVGEFNVISVDWSPLAKWPCYVSAANNVKTVANCTARQILNMMALVPQVINRDILHIIGFSLGAHVSGVIGYDFKILSNITVKWMTALEPALPLFDSVLVPADSRLSADDAEFVDVYHTDAGNKGVFSAVGDVDFYFNNGYYQPGCAGENNCDHFRAFRYYAESINPDSIGFWGAPCTLVNEVNLFTTDICKSEKNAATTQLAGYYVQHTAQGTYQVQTKSSAPFALGRQPQK